MLKRFEVKKKKISKT
jgi:hypothetical protein